MYYLISILLILAGAIANTLSDFKLVNIVQSLNYNMVISIGTLLAALLAAFFTSRAAKGAMEAASVSKKQLEKQAEVFHYQLFYDLLDSIEKAHNIKFTKRYKLSVAMKNNELDTCYTRYLTSLNNRISSIEKRKIQMNLNSIPLSYEHSLFEAYVDYAREVTNLFHFGFTIESRDSILFKVTGAKFPLEPHDPVNFSLTVSIVVSELLSFKNKGEYVEAEFKRICDEEKHFESFKTKYEREKENHNYQLILKLNG